MSVGPFFASARGSIFRAYAEQVYPLLEPGSVSLVLSDGPYGMSKAAWDRMRPSDLPSPTSMAGVLNATIEDWKPRWGTTIGGEE